MSSSARVLVINNDPEEAGFLTRKLHDRGYENVPRQVNMDSLEQVRLSKPDVVIIAGGDSAGSNLNLTRALKSRIDTAAVPIILFTPSGSETARTEGLRAGADACLPFPYHDLQLFGRIESLARLGAMQEELRRRSQTAAKYGLPGAAAIFPQNAIMDDANFLLVGAAQEHFEQIEQALCGFGALIHAQSPATALKYLERGQFDAILLNIPAGEEEQFFHFAASVRRNTRLFNIPIVCIMEAAASADPSEPYEAGAADVFRHPLNIGDFAARVEVLVRQQRYRDSLIHVYRQAKNVAVCDALTGLYSHGFMMEHLSGLVAESRLQHRSLTLGVFTLDSFADINRVYGYSIGDKVLRQVGVLISNLVRGEDLSARYSGHRFALIMPETRLAPGEYVAHRIGSVINYTEIMEGEKGVPIRPHVSTGVATLTPDMSAEDLVQAAIANSR